jgi:hypothetical protein
MLSARLEALIEKNESPYDKLVDIPGGGGDFAPRVRGPLGLRAMLNHDPK